MGDWVLRAGVRHSSVYHDYTLLGGVNPSVDKASWHHTLWNVGARWSQNDSLSWYANIGTGFMSPSGKQVGGTVLDPLNQSGQLPNSSLRSEMGMGNDIGFEYRPDLATVIGVRAFYNMIDDAIVDNVVNASPSQSQSFNAGKAIARGVEIDFQNRSSEWMQYFANITFNDTRIEDPANANTDGSEIPFVPSYVANVGVTALLPFTITGSGYVQRVGTYYDSTSKTGRHEFGNYTLLNARLQKNLRRSTDYSLNALVDLNNLTDEKFAMPWGFVDPGFNAMASLQVSF